MKLSSAFVIAHEKNNYVIWNNMFLNIAPYFLGLVLDIVYTYVYKICSIFKFTAAVVIKICKRCCFVVFLVLSWVENIRKVLTLYFMSNIGSACWCYSSFINSFVLMNNNGHFNLDLEFWYFVSDSFIFVRHQNSLVYYLFSNILVRFAFKILSISLLHVLYGNGYKTHALADATAVCWKPSGQPCRRFLITSSTMHFVLYYVFVTHLCDWPLFAEGYLLNYIHSGSFLVLACQKPF